MKTVEQDSILFSQISNLRYEIRGDDMCDGTPLYMKMEGCLAGGEPRYKETF